MTDRKPDMLSEILVARRPELAGKIHYVDGRPYCDGVNHTTRCDPASTPKRPIAMSLHFEDVDPVATCLVTGCGWTAHGDAMADATTAWAVHIAAKHRLDWGDDD